MDDYHYARNYDINLINIQLSINCVNLCMKLLDRGSQSIVASSWSYLCYTYDMDQSKVDYFSRRLFKIKYHAPSEDLKIKGSLIRDLVLYHHDNRLDSDVFELLLHLCRPTD